MTMALTIVGVASATKTDVGTPETTGGGIDEDGNETIFTSVIINHLHDLLH